MLGFKGLNNSSDVVMTSLKKELEAFAVFDPSF